MVSGVLSPLIKGLGSEIGHPPTCSAKVRMCRVILLIPPFIFMAWCLIHHKEDFVFVFIYMEGKGME
jgi:hypothetical protein